MFCDMVGSTALASRLDPEDLREINRAFEAACQGAIERYEGVVARYMGDGVLAYFGYPRAHEDDAERAVRAGLAVVESVNALNADIGKSKGAEVSVRVGIATGAVVVGDLIGEGASRERAVVGETPNLAARLQSFAEPDTVVVAPETKRLVGEAFVYRDRGERSAKGIEQPVRVWQVVEERLASSRFEAVRGRRLTAQVGRDEEMGILLARWGRARGGEGQVVLVAGEPGIGKSRLMEALRERIAEESHVRLRYQCTPYHTNSALYPVMVQLQHAAGIASADSSEEKLDKLEALLARSSDDLERDTALVASLLSIPGEERYGLPAMDAQRRKEATLDALLRQLEGLARRAPVLCLFEDVHWIDPSTHELLERMVERVESLPVLLLISFRPEFAASWSGQAHVTSLVLRRMAQRESRTMAEAVAGGAALGPETLEEIIAKTDGVPLYIEELTRTVLDSQASARDGQAGAPSVGIPATLQDSLMARLDRLPEGKQAAQIGAAIGREFTREVLAGVWESEPARLENGLEQLLDAQLVFRRGSGPKAEFTFKHALVQDAAYGSMLLKRRRDLHARIARFLESAFPEIPESEPEVLAYHYAEAEDFDRAAVFYERAGRRAAGHAAHLEAIGHYARGLEVVRQLADGAERARREVSLQIEAAESMRIVERIREAFDALEAAEATARRHGLDLELARIHHLRGNLHFPLGDTEGCLRAHERALEFAEKAGSPEYEARALGGMGDAHYIRGRLLTAREYFDRGITRARDRQLAFIEAAYLPMRALGHWYALDPERALDDYRLGVKIARDSDNLRAEVVSLSAGGYILLDMHEVDESRRAFDRALKLARRIGARRFVPLAEMYLARIAAMENRPGDAKRLAEAAIEVAREVGMSFVGPWVLGGYAAVVQDPADAEAALAEGEAILNERWCVAHNYFRFYRDAMEWALTAGRWTETDRYASALEEFTRDEPLPWCDFFIARARALSAHGKGQRDRDSMDTIRSLYDRAVQIGLVSAVRALEGPLAEN